MRNKIRKLATLVFGSLACIFFMNHGGVNAEVRVPAIIGDNMVLQAGMKVRLWGKAAPAERVTVSFNSKSAQATADSAGHWQTFIGPFKAGGPFELTIKGTNTVVFKNVLVGEVWVCSGQSNMEWPLINAKDGASTVAQANYPEIRLFTVQKDTSPAALDDVKGHWVVTTPETVGQFSAVGYFFGRELYQKLKTPIGLIHTSWGGTPAESWTSYEALSANAELKPILNRYQESLKSLPERQKKFELDLAQWEQKNIYADPGNKGEALGYTSASLNTTDWQKMNLPQYFETAGPDIDGAVWFRKEVDVPQSWGGRDLVLSLPPIDDYDTTYFNGTRVGGLGKETPESYSRPRRYHVPGSLVHAGRNLISVRVFDSAGNGGFGAGDMSLTPAGANGTETVKLNGPWDYKVEVALEPKHPDWGSRPQAAGPNN
ncbi:MAG TPA: sialate O-acetylesterase, partial [Pyrinomonadaceae bacterium]|nr:sialate O-acetylesterase [Pyrinomonadaceae bacterium]